MYYVGRAVSFDVSFEIFMDEFLMQFTEINWNFSKKFQFIWNT